MADTIRVLSALQTLLADNTSGTISPQDVRDLLISVLGSLFGVADSSGLTLDDDDIVIIGTGGAGGITITLPAVASSQHKFYFILKGDSGAGAVTIDGNASEEINGATTKVLSNQYDGVLIWCDGTEWFILAAT